MTLDQETVARIARQLELAETTLTPIAKITDEFPEMEWDDAYAIQFEIRRLKLARGIRVAGLKMGLTSPAKMKQMGVTEPVYGFITDQGACMEGEAIPIGKFIHPRIEPEIAVVTRTVLRGPGCHVAAAHAAIDFVLPAVEILDSRYRDFKFDLKSVIADNTSSAAYVVGGRMMRPADLDLRTLGVVVMKNGEVIDVGAGAAVLGHPAASVARLANMLAQRGEEIPAGTFIMTGGITSAVPVAAGDSIHVCYQHLGSVTCRFV